MIKMISIIFMLLLLLTACSNTVENGSRSSDITADAGADQTVREGETIHFSAVGSSDSAGNIVSYEWLDDDGAVLSDEASFSTSTLSVKDHIITLKVTNENGATGVDTVKVTVFVAIYHKGTTYNTVTSPYTGKVWLDRNVGASRICTAANDTECYGDFYQWGRNTDGHEKSTSSVTTLQATSVTDAGSSFITSANGFNGDWARDADPDGSLRSFNWSKTDGSSVCPVTYRVPILDELKAETVNVGVEDRNDAFSNFLKLPSAGYRSGYIESMYSQGYIAQLWSSDVIGSSLGSLGFTSVEVKEGSSTGSNGMSVRCIKD